MRKLVSVIPPLAVLAASAAMFLVIPGMIDRYAVAQQSARMTLARQVLDDDDILRRIDRAVSAIADAIAPTVVHIETDSGRGGFSSRGFASGAGWIYDTRGHVITNAHVVQSADTVSVELSSGRVTEGRVIGTDVYTDIAVIRIDPGYTTLYAERAPERLPRVGERVFAFGSPFGFKFSMSEGIVSGLGRQAAGTGILGGYTNYIQTDAAVNPGNSGGPLVNTDGHIVGMNVAIATAANSVGSSPEEAGADSAGISFAIPLGTIEPIVNQIIEHGSVSRGYLGIRFDPRRQGRVSIENDEGGTELGVRVTDVEEGGPSETAGLEADDVIVRVDGSPVINAEALSSLISSRRAGDTIRVELYRDGDFLDKRVTLGAMQDEVIAQRLAQPMQIQMGAILRDHPRGVVVLRTWDGLPAAAAGLGAEDVVTRVNGERFEGLAGFFVRLADEGLLTGEPIDLRVRRADGSTETITLRLM